VLEDGISFSDINSPEIEEYIGTEQADVLREEIDLVEGVYNDFNVDDYRNATLAPVFFGSALNNFGVRELLHCFLEIAPSPLPSKTDVREVYPDEEKFSGFVFKIHANMDPNHRNRIAFVRVCSGKIERNKNFLHVRLGKNLKFSSPTAFMAQKKSIVDEAWPGDIIGIPNHGTLRVGDTLSEKNQIHFTGLPNFAPEILRRVALVDPTKTKQLRKALDDLSEEGVIQVFYPELGGQWIVGVVGQLQLDVLISRLSAEYKVEARLEASPFATARWIRGEDKAMNDFKKFNLSNLAKDRDGDLVFMAKSPWDVNYQQEKNPDLTFSATKER
jgi:peptide chain release factor 3